jgi:hypothetical protein
VRPDPPFVMRAALKTLEEVSAGLTDTQAVSRLRGVMSLLSVVQGEWDTCASSRAAGISRYTDVVRAGARLMTGERRERLRQVLAGTEATASDLRISALEMTLDRLRAAVIDLQAWLEETEEPEAQELLALLWRAEHDDAKSEDRNHSFW